MKAAKLDYKIVMINWLIK